MIVRVWPRMERNCLADTISGRTTKAILGVRVLLLSVFAYEQLTVATVRNPVAA